MTIIKYCKECTGHIVVDDLEFLKVVKWKVEMEGVAVVKFGLDWTRDVAMVLAALKSVPSRHRKVPPSHPSYLGFS